MEPTTQAVVPAADPTSHMSPTTVRGLLRRRRCEVIEHVWPCWRPAVATVLWHTGGHSHMCRRHLADLDRLDWTEIGPGRTRLRPLTAAPR